MFKTDFNYPVYDYSNCSSECDVYSYFERYPIAYIEYDSWESW